MSAAQCEQQVKTLFRDALFESVVKWGFIKRPVTRPVLHAKNRPAAKHLDSELIQNIAIVIIQTGATSRLGQRIVEVQNNLELLKLC